VLVVRRAFLRDHPEIVKRLLAAHVEATLRLNADPEAGARLISDEIKRETSAAMPLPIVRSALRRVEFSWEPLPNALAKAADDAHRVGFLPTTPDLSGIWELGPLREVLREKGLPALAEGIEGPPR
jgi:NitT/TauT family transport system substrate-binding protein